MVHCHTCSDDVYGNCAGFLITTSMIWHEFLVLKVSLSIYHVIIYILYGSIPFKNAKQVLLCPNLSKFTVMPHWCLGKKLVPHMEFFAVSVHVSEILWNRFASINFNLTITWTVIMIIWYSDLTQFINSLKLWHLCLSLKSYSHVCSSLDGFFTSLHLLLIILLLISYHLYTTREPNYTSPASHRFPQFYPFSPPNVFFC